MQIAVLSNFFFITTFVQSRCVRVYTTTQKCIYCQWWPEETIWYDLIISCSIRRASCKNLLCRWVQSRWSICLLSHFWFANNPLFINGVLNVDYYRKFMYSIYYYWIRLFWKWLVISTVADIFEGTKWKKKIFL